MKMSLIVSNQVTQAFLVLQCMQKNQKPVVAERTVAAKPFWKKYCKPTIITASVIGLQLIFGFDPKFCIINIIRSEEHTSELQSRENLVCRLLLEKKKTFNHQNKR